MAIALDIQHLKLQATFEDPTDIHHDHPEDGRLTWRRLCHLGSGAFGTVWKEQCIVGRETQLNTLRAVKQSPKHQRVAWKRELQAMSKFSAHTDHFVQCSGWFESPEHLYIAMELMPYGSLQAHITQKPLPESDAAIVVAQISQAVRYMHQVNFIHRDLKPLNILVCRPGPKWHVKVADFGISKELTLTPSSTNANIGTLGYTAPEVLLTNSNRFSPAIDIWSLGAIAHCLVTRRPPFLNVYEMIEYVKPGSEFPIHMLRKRRCSFYCEDFVQTAMKAERGERMGIEQVLSHAWLEPLTDDELLDTEESWKASKRWTDTWNVDPKDATKQVPTASPDFIGHSIQTAHHSEFSTPLVRAPSSNVSLPMNNDHDISDANNLEAQNIARKDFSDPSDLPRRFGMLKRIRLPLQQVARPVSGHYVGIDATQAPLPAEGTVFNSKYVSTVPSEGSIDKADQDRRSDFTPHDNNLQVEARSLAQQEQKRREDRPKLMTAAQNNVAAQLKQMDDIKPLYAENASPKPALRTVDSRSPQEIMRDRNAREARRQQQALRREEYWRAEEHRRAEERRVSALSKAVALASGTQQGREQEEDAWDSLSNQAAGIKNSHVDPSVFDERPPFEIERDEAQHQAALRASAISMAKQLKEMQDRAAMIAYPADAIGTPAAASRASTTYQFDVSQKAMQYISLQAEAQRLAGERLAKIDADLERKAIASAPRQNRTKPTRELRQDELKTKSSDDGQRSDRRSKWQALRRQWRTDM